MKVSSVKEILNKIVSLQSLGGNGYDAGLFPSQRIHPLLGYSREDNNVFFSALIAFTLQQLDGVIPPDLVNKTRMIREAVIKNYKKYRHYADLTTYNFWQNQPNSHFPNGWLLNKLPLMALPADSDDTSIIYLTSADSGDLTGVKKTLESQYSPDSPISSLTPPAYQDLRAYPTFLGKKILREMDACVISNVMYLVCHYRLPWTSVDYDSVKFLFRVLERNDHRRSSFLISPNYGNAVVVLYHIARLVGSFNHKNLDSLREPLVKCLKQELNVNLDFMETILVNTSLLRLQQHTLPIHMPKDFQEHFKKFHFFQAGMLTAFQNIMLKWPSQVSIFHLKYRCEAYYWTLVLEYLLISGD